MEKVYIVAAQRTPIGKFNGELAPLTAVQLGATVIKDTVAKAGLVADQIDQVLMGNVIQAVPPAPLFDDYAAEDAGLLQTPLSDAWEVWNDAFLTGKKSIETDWDAYVAEMQSKGIETFCNMYNEHMAK